MRQDQSRSRTNAVSSVIFSIAVLVMCGGGLSICNSPRAIFGRYSVEGVVVGPPGSKSSFTVGSRSSMGAGTQKFSVPLDTNGDSRADRIVNCSSTQCASLADGDRVVLSCFSEWHATVPNEEECRFDHLAQ